MGGYGIIRCFPPEIHLRPEPRESTKGTVTEPVVTPAESQPGGERKELGCL
jgi:hypothetical protein